ncbi:LPS assembly protein LptD [Vibrio algarum]|uniref:LPS-assembly protein LptD n=1 Tax=Vibrio algarum TaxID=3020714 RepID=A0ABT4YL43_9VIBR|nr:LPS assembly protein LptD [Vibrio sp. KJ40-1]MDB1122262.1 LPS assembly protein LptD [Vibrio sp. KJ40-1]
MLLFPRTLLAASISAAAFVPTTQAETSQDPSVQEMPSTDQCLIADSSSKSSTEVPVHVEADNVEAINGDKATYTGDVVITQGHKRISADTVTLYQQDNTVIAEGNVHSYDGQIKTISDKATTSLDSDVATLENTQYQFLCEDGRGDAKVIYRKDKAFYELEDGSITSCPEGDNAWRLRASSIEIDQVDEEATLFNPRVEVLSVPVFYLPYLTVPIGDTRKTGFLYPSVSYDSKNGFGFTAPVYWNLAPNYDLQTDFNYMEKRGTQLDAEFRYLTNIGSGSINLEYLPDDQKYPDEGDRWGVNWVYSGIVKGSWKFDIDYSKVSDISYFTDLDSNIGNREDGQLLQSGEVSYRSNNWDTTLLVRDFQVLSESSYPYRLMPQLEYNYYAPHFYSNLDFNLLSHVSRFETDDPDSPSATRLHVEPTLSLPLSNTWGTITAEAKLFQTYYEQDLDNLTDSNDYEEQVSRTIPQFRIHSGLYLERDTTQISGYTQTLEPQIQYLYTPDEDQSEIYSGYDTTKLQLDYDGLFRSKKYSSVDYIAPANQLSYGASTRFFDDEFKERMNLSFGQIIYLNDSYNDDASDETSSSYSAWALDTEFNYDDYLFYQGGFQYDTASSEVQLADSTFEYRYSGGYSQINYRYVSLDYIASNVDFISDDDYTSYTREGISQLGFITAYNIGRNWKLNGQYFYDTNENVNLEWLAGVNYTSDCWYIGFSYSNQLYDWDEIGVGSPTYEQNFTLNFGIIGFGQTLSGGSGLAGVDTSNASLGYSRPFYLNN